VKQEVNKTQFIPNNQLVFGLIVQWITIASAIIALIAPVLILLMPQNNVINPNHVFSLIFSGEGKDVLWQQTSKGFPGGYFYLQEHFYGDGFAQFGIVLGCSAAFWALIPSIIMYLKSRDYLYAGICIFIAFLIGLAMTGLIALKV